MAAHKNAVGAAKLLCQSIGQRSGHAMAVNFVTDAQIAKGVTPATFSFNLPPPAHLKDNSEALAGFAQAFVDKLCADWKGVKPCVSFGQKNSTVYATVPATSTQGVISEEDKAKQAVGGIQLVRFSFPPTMDMGEWGRQIDRTAAAMYAKPPTNSSLADTLQSLQNKIEEVGEAVASLGSSVKKVDARVVAVENTKPPPPPQQKDERSSLFTVMVSAAVGVIFGAVVVRRLLN